MRIPFNKPFIIGKETDYLLQSVASGHIAGDGLFTRKCHALLQKALGARRILLTTSCTAALEMAAILCEVGPEDEVILPSFTFVSTANAFYGRGARLVFCDIRQDTLNLDEAALESLLTERTKVIVPVHYGGIGCEMDVLTKLAAERGILVVEDAAHGLAATYRDRHLGTIGDLGAFSFHETKNCICGEGGALAINNPIFEERAEIIRDKGTNRSRFFRGEVDKYTWVDIGSSYLPSDLLAAFLFAQLERLEEITARRRQIYERYLQGLAPLAERGIARLPSIPEHCRSSYHLFPVILQDEKTRDELLRHLNSRGIGAVFHYVPLHSSPVGRSLGYVEGQFPVTESVSARLLRLPFHHGLKLEEQAEVIAGVLGFFSLAGC